MTGEGEAESSGSLHDRLVTAQLTGQPLDLRPDPVQARTIDGEDFRTLLVCADPKTTHPLGLHVAGLIVAGKVDLSYCTVERPLDLREARIDGPLLLGRLHIPALDITGSTVADVWAPSLDVTYSLCLEGTTIARQLWLVGAGVGGDLLLDGLTVLHEDATGKGSGRAGTPAVTVYGARITGSWMMRQARVRGLVRLSNAVLGGDVVIADSAIERLPEVAGRQPRPVLLDARRTRFGADATLRGVVVDGEVFMSNCTVAGVLDVGGSTVGGVDDGGVDDGGVDDGDGLTLDGASVGGDLLLHDGFGCRGPLRLVDTAVGGSLRLQDCSLHVRKCSLAGRTPDGASALLAVGTKVSGTLTLRDVDLSGGLTLYGASADVLEDGVGHGGARLDLGVWARATTIDLRDLSYRRFGPRSTTAVTDRIAWLEQLPGYDDTAWRQLGQVYLAQGREDDARDIAIAAQDVRCSRTLKGPRRLGRRTLGVTIGHGYQPGRAVVIAAIWVVLFTLVLQVWSSDITHASTSTALPYKAAYALDVFLPIIDLGLSDAWKVTGLVQWAGWATIIAGWALSTLLVSAFSRVVRNP